MRSFIALDASSVLALDDDCPARVLWICATKVDDRARRSDPHVRRSDSDRFVSSALVGDLDNHDVDAHGIVESFLVEANVHQAHRRNGVICASREALVASSAPSSATILRERACSVHNEIDSRAARGAVSRHGRVEHRRIVEMLYAANQELKSMTENLAADVMHAIDGLVVADHRTGG